MAIVDVEYDVYKCPHCLGFIEVRRQYPYTDYGCTVSLTHHPELPKYLEGEEPILEMEKAK